ncbi:MAG: glycosyltransferase family 2 protein [Acidimicrobiales bacterium]
MAVIIPARNEGEALAILLPSLGAQTLAPAELVVVDDASEDQTAVVARQLGAAVVTADPVPPGWTGKTWACVTGVRSTTSPLLVFLDADVHLAPDALERLIADHGRRGGHGLLSVAPEHVALRPHERLSAMCQLVAMMGTGAFSPMPRWTAAPSAFGPCIVCWRADYEAVGGHTGVRAEMAEDMALARRFRDAGRPTWVVSGRELVRIRMYPDGLSQLLAGWARTLASGALATRPLTMALVVAWVSGLIGAAGAAGAAAAGLLGGAPRRARDRARLARYVAYALQVEWLLSRVAAFGAGTGLAYPLPLAAFLACLTRSVAVRIGPGRVSWKGRSVPVSRAGSR